MWVQTADPDASSFLRPSEKTGAVCPSKRGAVRLHSFIHSSIHSLTQPMLASLEGAVRMGDGTCEEN